jgi:hypothetical protein
LNVTAEQSQDIPLFDRALFQLGTYTEQGSQRRIYFDNLVGWLQLEIERDETGEPVSATRGGQPISTSNAVRIENQLRRARFSWDLNDHVFRALGLDSINKSDLSKAVTERAEAMIEAGEVDESTELPRLAQDEAAEATSTE